MYDRPEFGLHVKAVAREWSKLQLGALAFTGLCGVLMGDNGSSRPAWLQDISGLSAVVGLLLALLGVALVGNVAFPLALAPRNPLVAALRLQAGISLTFVAVAFTGLSALSMWWPHNTDQNSIRPGDRVIISTTFGATCATIVASTTGSIDLRTNGAIIQLPRSVVSIKATTSC